MSIVSLKFIGFLCILLVLYYIVPLKVRWCVLLIGSLYFYLEAGKKAFLFIIVTSLLSFGAGLVIKRIYSKQEEYLKSHEMERDEKREFQRKNKLRCKYICIGISLILISMLIYTKSGNIEWIRNILFFVTGNNPYIMNIFALLGISYYTFSAIAYIADVYWKKENAETNYFAYLLFLIYFPKILQGPISRHKNIGRQLVEGHRFDYKKVCFGAQLMMWGYFKKMVIADRLLIIVNEVFGNYQKYPGSILVVGTIFAALQLYCDFSGCMDIIGGASELFGIELEKNFNHPFFSKSAAEFWRRWHITLGTWFKDYIYMPLVVSPRMMKLTQKVGKAFGKRAGKSIMVIVPSSIVWLLTGLWHGTGIPYIVWGIYWGILIIFSTVFEPEIKKLNRFLHIRTDAGSWKVFQMIRTFIIFGIGRIITVPNDLKVSGEILISIAKDFQIWKLFDGSLFQLGLDRPEFLLSIVTIVILWGVSMLQERGSVREKVASSNIVFRWTFYYAAFFAIIIFGVYGLGYDASSFVYMNY